MTASESLLAPLKRRARRAALTGMVGGLFFAAIGFGAAESLGGGTQVLRWLEGRAPWPAVSDLSAAELASPSRSFHHFDPASLSPWGPPLVSAAVGVVDGRRVVFKRADVAGGVCRFVPPTGAIADAMRTDAGEPPYAPQMCTQVSVVFAHMSIGVTGAFGLVGLGMLAWFFAVLLHWRLYYRNVTARPTDLEGDPLLEFTSELGEDAERVDLGSLSISRRWLIDVDRRGWKIVRLADVAAATAALGESDAREESRLRLYLVTGRTLVIRVALPDVAVLQIRARAPWCATGPMREFDRRWRDDRAAIIEAAVARRAALGDAPGAEDRPGGRVADPSPPSGRRPMGFVFTTEEIWPVRGPLPAPESCPDAETLDTLWGGVVRGTPTEVALEWLQALHARWPDDMVIQTRYAAALLDAGRVGEGARLAEGGVARDPADLRAHRVRLYARRLHHDPPGMLDAAMALLEVCPGDPAALAARLEAIARLGRTEAARAELQATLAASPDVAEHALPLFRGLAGAEAADALARRRAAEPDSPDWAWAWLMVDRTDADAETIALARSHAARRPDDAVAWWRLAWILADAFPDEALQAVERARALAPADEETLDAYFRLTYRLRGARAAAAAMESGPWPEGARPPAVEALALVAQAEERRAPLPALRLLELAEAGAGRAWIWQTLCAAATDTASPGFGRAVAERWLFRMPGAFRAAAQAIDFARAADDRHGLVQLSLRALASHPFEAHVAWRALSAQVEWTGAPLESDAHPAWGPWVLRPRLVDTLVRSGPMAQVVRAFGLLHPDQSDVAEAPDAAIRALVGSEDTPLFLIPALLASLGEKLDLALGTAAAADALGFAGACLWVQRELDAGRSALGHALTRFLSRDARFLPAVDVWLAGLDGDLPEAGKRGLVELTDTHRDILSTSPELWAHLGALLARHVSPKAAVRWWAPRADRPDAPPLALLEFARVLVGLERDNEAADVVVRAADVVSEGEGLGELWLLGAFFRAMRLEFDAAERLLARADTEPRRSDWEVVAAATRSILALAGLPTGAGGVDRRAPLDRFVRASKGMVTRQDPLLWLVYDLTLAQLDAITRD